MYKFLHQCHLTLRWTQQSEVLTIGQWNVIGPTMYIDNEVPKLYRKDAPLLAQNEPRAKAESKRHQHAQ